MFDFLIELGFKSENNTTFQNSVNNTSTIIKIDIQSNNDKNLLSKTFNLYTVDIMFDIDLSGYYQSKMVYGFVASDKTIKDRITTILDNNNKLCMLMR